MAEIQPSLNFELFNRITEAGHSDSWATALKTWAQRLKRVFGIGIDIETCQACGGAVRIIASIEDPEVIEKILTHLDTKGAASEASRRPPCRAPPKTGLFE